MRLMKFPCSDYVLRPDGTYAKKVEFMGKGAKHEKVDTRLTLVRSARTGRLLRVERRRKP